MIKDDDKKKALDAALAQIEKQYGKGSVMKLGDSSANMNIEVIPTGSLSLDIALGLGGVPRGRIIEVFGPESSGKTTVALHIVAEIQKRGGIAGFIDAGNGYYYADFANGVEPCLVSYEFADEHKNVPVAALANEYFDGFVNIVRKRFAEAAFDEELTPLYIRKSQAEERR